MSSASMTGAERESMLKIVRMNERVAKTAAKQRAAELMAEFEAKLSAEFRYDDDAVWKTVRDEAARAVAEADSKVAARCAELGIPARFRPSLVMGWSGRGENAVAQRRTELRIAARKRVEALEATARNAIERRSAEVQTSIISGGLITDEARACLASLPKPEDLMPSIAFEQLEGPTS